MDKSQETRACGKKKKSCPVITTGFSQEYTYAPTLSSDRADKLRFKFSKFHSVLPVLKTKSVNNSDEDQTSCYACPLKSYSVSHLASEL